MRAPSCRNLGTCLIFVRQSMCDLVTMSGKSLAGGASCLPLTSAAKAPSLSNRVCSEIFICALAAWLKTGNLLAESTQELEPRCAGCARRCVRCGSEVERCAVECSRGSVLGSGAPLLGRSNADSGWKSRRRRPS
jgi:hypothetical protein